VIVVKLVGGARKSFPSDKIEINKNSITIKDLLHHLLDIKPKDTPTLDIDNVLVAVNGADSSSMQGKETIVKKDDVVSIIPIIHGGQNNVSFKICNRNVRIFEIKGSKDTNVNLLDYLRKKYPQLTLQAISSKFILNRSHIEKILQISLESEKNQTLLSNKIETDILMRFAITTQISNAINLAGLKPHQNFILICIGSKRLLDKIENEISARVTQLFERDKSFFLKKQFKITNKHLDSVLSDSPLEDILVEKATVLF